MKGRQGNSVTKEQIKKNKMKDKTSMKFYSCCLLTVNNIWYLEGNIWGCTVSLRTPPVIPSYCRKENKS